MAEPDPVDQTLALAEEVLRELQAHHGYPRDTQDLDLAVATPPRRLHEIADALRSKGGQVEVRDPDPVDPLGGVVDVQKLKTICHPADRGLR